MTLNIDESLEGNRVVNANGDEVGMISSVRGGTAYVDPDPGLTESIKSKLGWEDVDSDDYPLREEAIDFVEEDEIHLKSQL
jgi:hypothetical protein